jgi:hypothetical protein
VKPASIARSSSSGGIGDPRALAIDVARASGLGLLRGRVLLPTPRLVALARAALASVKAVEGLELVPADGEVRIHLVVQMMGQSTRVVVRVAVAAFHLDARGGSLRLRLLEPPTFAGKHGGRSGGVLGMIGAFGEAALSSMGPERILATVAEFLGPPLAAKGDTLIVDLGKIPALAKALSRETGVGKLGELVYVSGARFRPGGLEIFLRARPKTAIEGVRRLAARVSLFRPR